MSLKELKKKKITKENSKQHKKEFTIVKNYHGKVL